MFSTLEDAATLPYAPTTGLDVSSMNEEELYRAGETFNQGLEAQQEAADNASMLQEGIGHLRFNTLAYSLGEDWLDKRTSTPDPWFNLQKTLTEQQVNYKELPEWQRDLMDTAVSREHLEKIQDRIADREAWKQNAENLSGVKGFAADLLSEVFNPINWIPGMVYKAPTAVARFAGNAIIAGTLSGAELGAAAHVYHDITTSDVVASVVGGALVGGTIGTVIGRNGAERQGIAREIMVAAESNADTHTRILTESLENEGSVGAARVDPYVELTDQVHAQFRGDPTDPHVMEAFLKVVDDELPQSKAFIRPDAIVGMSESLQRSDNPMARYLGSKILEHGEGTGGRQQAEFTADLLSDVYFSEVSGHYASSYTKNFRRFKEAIKGTDVRPQDFGDLVYKDINAQSLLLTETPYEQLSELQKVIRDQANAVMSVKKRVNALARSKGVTEMGEFNPTTFNMTRQYDGNAFVRLANLHGKESVIQLIKRAVLTGEHFEKYLTKTYGPDEARPDLDAIAYRIGQAVFNRMSNRAVHQGADANILTTSNKKLLLQALRDINIPEADFVHIKRILDTAGKDRFADPTKGQISMNMSAEFNGLKMTDLLNTDMAAGVMADIKYWTGRAALAEVGFPDRGVYDTALDSMTEIGKSRAPTDSPSATAEALQRTQSEYNKLDKAWDLITGMPIDAVNTPVAKTMRALRKLASVSKLGKLGFAQAAETARMVTAIGVRNVVEGIPYLTQMRRNVLTGKLSDSILQDLEDAGMGRIGDEYMLRSPDFRVDDLHANAFLGEKHLDNLNYAVGHLSGFNAVSAMQKRFFARQYAMKLYRTITQDKLSDAVRNELGWSAGDVSRIKNMMLTRVDDTGISLFNNRKPVNLNVSYWDGDLREKFIAALHRASNRAILKQSVGDLPLWAHTSIGKFFSQFRSFALASGGKQGVYDLKMLKAGNVEGLNTFLFTTAMATGLYMAKVQIDAAGLTGSERNKFLTTRLSPAALTRGCLAWQGQLGIGSEALDYIGFGLLNWGGDDDSIHFNRGVEFSDALSSVPGIGYVSDLTRGTAGLLRAGLTDYKFKRADARALLSTLPMSNLMGITNARNLIQERF